jgi:hypothetical protein
VLIVCALGDEGADFFLDPGIRGLESGGKGDWEITGVADFGKDFLFFEFPQLGRCSLKIVARFVCNASHFWG